MEILKFIAKNNNKKLIVVQGLGFVGSVMSLVCANSRENYAVIGLDIPTKEGLFRINSLNNGKFPLEADDPLIDKFYRNALSNGNFLASSDASAIKYADIVIVDINLDVIKCSTKDSSLKSYDVDLTGFKAAISTIGNYCKSNALVLVETTVPPGTCERIVKPILLNKLSERNLSHKKLKIAHSYERVMPGPQYINSIQNYPRVYSGIDDNSANAAEVFLKTIINTDKCDLTRLKSTTASEMAKVLENSYRASNIAFAVEWSRFAEEADVDLWSIVDAIRVRKTHSNLMYPGIGVGGYCLTKDPLLASWASKEFFASNNELNMSIRSVSINDQMPVFAYERLKKVFGSLLNLKIVFFGVSYRGDVGDTRFSPVETLYRLIKSDTSSIKVHDPYVSKWNELDISVSYEVDEVLIGSPDIIIISTAHSKYRSEEFVSKLVTIDNCKIFDTVGLLSKNQIYNLKQKHEISILGSGEII
jgi:UDP-N-acetyl-D-glucosamine dehydrogenase